MRRLGLFSKRITLDTQLQQCQHSKGSVSVAGKLSRLFFFSEANFAGERSSRNGSVLPQFISQDTLPGSQLSDTGSQRLDRDERCSLATILDWEGCWLAVLRRPASLRFYPRRNVEFHCWFSAEVFVFRIGKL